MMNPAQAKIELLKKEKIVRHIEPLATASSFFSVNVWVGYEFFMLRHDEKLAVLTALDDRYHPKHGTDILSSAGCDPTMKTGSKAQAALMNLAAAH